MYHVRTVRSMNTLTHFTFHSHNNPEIGAVIPVLEIKKLRPREVK